MDYNIYANEKNIPSKIFSNDNVKEIKIRDDGSTVIDESSNVVIDESSNVVIDESLNVIDEEELRAAEGIIYVLIFCIPFWILFIKFAICSNFRKIVL